ncbi:MAG: DUF493 domain-containing protein [Planctomycetaceae bacterium]|nr:DUF493 domain-containing protein [Planctomycetaceae bacterium]
MSELPPVELLEATHQFPGQFVFKAIGRGDERFVAEIVAAIRSELDHEFDSPYELTHSSKGKHVSVTITPWVETAVQVLAVYARLQTIDGVAFVL